jgi:hypothetical protein
LKRRIYRRLRSVITAFAAELSSVLHLKASASRCVFEPLQALRVSYDGTLSPQLYLSLIRGTLPHGLRGPDGDA